MLFPTCSKQALDWGAVQSIRHGKNPCKCGECGLCVQYGRISAAMGKLLALAFVMQVDRYFPSQLLSLLNKTREKYR